MLEEPTYDALARLARRTGSSLSQAARDLLREALETYEDRAVAAAGEHRLATFDASSALSHDEVWGVGKTTSRR